MEEAFFTVKEMADILKVDPQTLRKYIRTGKLQALRLGGKGHRIPRSELQRLGEFDTQEIIEKMVQKRLEERK